VTLEMIRNTVPRRSLWALSVANRNIATRERKLPIWPLIYMFVFMGDALVSIWSLWMQHEDSLWLPSWCARRLLSSPCVYSTPCVASMLFYETKFVFFLRSVHLWSRASCLYFILLWLMFELAVPWPAQFPLLPV